MKNLILTSIILITFSVCSFSQKAIWTSGIQGTGEVYPIRSAIDFQNNVYILGRFDNSLTSPASVPSKGGKDLFLAKYDKNGVFKWLKQIGSSLTEQASGLALDASGNVYVAGRFQGTCYFEGSSLTSTGGVDIFLAKYSPEGFLTWVSPIGTGSTFQGSQNLTIDKDGNLVLIGIFQTSIDLKGTVLSESTATYTNFFAKFDSNANLLWAKKVVNKNANSNFYGITSSNDGYYFTASLIDTIYLDIAKVGSKKNSLNNYTYDILLYKTDFNGNGQWYSKVAGTGDDNNISAESDLSGNVYITGYFNSTSLAVDSISSNSNVTPIASKRSTSSVGSNDIFFAKYSSDGILQWFDAKGSVGDDRLTRLYTNGPYIVIAGQYAGSMTFNNEILAPVGGTDALGVVHDQNDNLLYAISAGGTGTDIIQTCVIDNEGNYVFIGDFTSPTITFDATHSLTNSNPGTKDMFIAKYKSRSITLVEDPIKCAGSATGSISANPKGAWVGDKVYLWSKKGDLTFSRTVANIENLATGTYYCKISDDLNFDIDSITLTEPPALSVSERIHTNATCYNATNGVLKPRITGGTGARTFLWSGNGTGIKATDSIQTALSAGNYNLTVTDANGCTKPLNNMVITQPGKINFNNTVVTKINGVQGAVDLSIQGGTPAFTYAWSGPSGFTATTQNIGNILVVGDYTINVTDQNLCTADTTVLIPNSLVFYAYVSDKQHVKCKTGSTGSISIALENLPTLNTATYQWTKDGNAIAANTETISGLAIGTYAVTVTAVPNGTAFTVNNIKINEPATSLGVTLTPNNITCFGVIDGFIDANPTGGTLPYTYQWTKDGGAFASVSEVISGLSKANYSVTVTDANNCTQVAGTSITEPSVISINSAIVTEVTCTGTKNDGAISLNVTGGTGAYGFRWSNGLTTQNISLLSAGTYRCTITDVNKCVTSTQQTVGQPSPIVASFNNTNISCFGGSDGAINLTPSGGNTGGYTFLWENGSTLEDRSLLAAATYTVTVTDSKSCEKTFATNLIEPSDIILGASSIQNVNCNGAANGNISLSTSGGTLPYIWVWSNNKTGSVATNLSPGNYSVTVTDGKNCTKPASFVITEPTPLVVSETLASHKDVACNGASTGELEVIASGSTGTYEFSLDGSVWQSTGLFNSVSSASYAVQVRDQSVTSCFKTVSPAIAITQPAAIVFSLPTVTPITCFGLTNGSLNTPASGGTGLLSYALKLNGTASSNASGASTGLFTSLAASTGYTVEVTDAAGCGPVASSSLDIIEPAQLSFSNPTITDITCFGLTNGSINAPATGGTGTLAYTLKLNSIALANTSGVASGAYSSLGAGTNYTIEVTDVNNCGPVATSNIAIAEPQVISIISEDSTRTSAPGASNGSITVVASGGTGILSYSLNGTSQTSGAFTNLPKGSYTVNVTDANLCGPVSSNLLKVADPPTAVDLITGGFIRLYPNPVSEIAFIEASNVNVDKLTLELRSISGKAIIIRKYENVNSNFGESIDVSQLPKGVYVVIMNGIVLKDKLIIQ